MLCCADKTNEVNAKHSLLVDAARHVFNVLCFVLQAAVVVVGLHTGLDLTTNGGTQLSAECAFLERNKKMMMTLIFTHY